jgi:aryl-alcohol dehydrogenase-like predicted oxidoreductase
MIERILFGCHNLTAGSSSGRSARLIEAALSLGIHRFDVAPSYGLGTAEAMLGRALGAQRYRVEITSKFGILPARFGFAAVWVREPYRALRRLLPQRPGPRLQTQAVAPVAGAPPAFPFSARVAVERSLRRLGVDHLDAMLIHERIEGRFALGLGDELAELKRRGLIARWGMSGTRANVQDMISLAGSPDIVQVALGDAQTFAGAPELRLFNLRHGAEGTSAAEIAARLAEQARAVLCAHRNAAVLFNTSSVQHLELFVKAL